MTALRLALTELRRIAASRVGRLALVAMVLVPSIYGGLYLYANDDPYGRLSEVPAALVVEDEGTTLSGGERLEVGDQVADELLEARTFDWARVARERAETGLEDGDYDLVLVLPAQFSADLASSATNHPRQATLEIRTNDANNYLARTIANTLVSQVTASVAEQVSSTAASRFLEGFADIHAEVSDAADGAVQLAKGASSAHDGAGTLATGADRLVGGQEQLASGADDLADGADDLADGLATLRSSTTELPSQTRELADGARQVAQGDAEVAAAGRQVADATDDLLADLKQTRSRLAQDLQDAGLTPEQRTAVLERVDALSGPVEEANARVQSTADDLDTLSEGADQVADGAERLAAAAPELTDGIARAADGSTQLSSGARRLADGEQDALSGSRRLASGAHDLDDGLDELSSGASTLADGLAEGVRDIPDPSAKQRRAMAETIGSPVAVDRDAEAAAGSYGAGLAPFFMSLALWIGGFVLFTRMRALSTRALAAGQPAWRVALGGWLGPALLGAAQAVVAFGVVALGVGIDVAHPVLLVLFMVGVSAAFLAVIHVLMARFGVVGQFLALVLMVLQLVSAGGTFPWQTLPGPLHPLHHALPMSYAVDGVRRLMYGGPLPQLALDVAVIGGWALGALALATLAARRAGTWTASRVKPELAA
ncbi:YhgE/Pip domain-containing protein [Phycicoccus endophyticus]|uniref:YhgE/Pip domain-containing protein n=1 Tax=Phycicoccus endophyticus TaxID=1690220 RepID=A0A7G9R0E7_9MICO|nr:YhgE/Pip domain-containing protein [Phycicoccus endophyticus]NHI20111.1 YhgE/Pip domain-containing protein [Phycicoccus endophyticus]QNN49072.1 YhgE/Pip domain-containing protein [Phycicoccus endophyticus]GGL38325.1 ABC transporter [Phycicoccus endophyticus]